MFFNLIISSFRHFAVLHALISKVYYLSHELFDQ